MLIIVNITMPPPAAFTARAAAAYCGCKTKELPPACYGAGRRRRWRRVILDDWLSARAVSGAVSPEDWQKAAKR